ncbi:uncharacterized protein [Antedon mediterranea]|uniref:uncharacterized protein n=1 Tax=Antedon mediterranea TaxID=105859 RepID=UPI003AF4CC79
MVTGHLPFTTPHSENKRLNLLQQIQFGLGPRHGADLQHVSTDCQELLTSCIEPNPERRIPLLDIELHLWITNRGKELFTSYRQLPKDKNTSLKVLEKMSGYLKLPVNQIKQRVNDYQLDEYSAIYNIMLDDVMQKKHSVNNGDHTLKQKPTVQHTSILKPEQSVPTDNDTSQEVPESPRPKTPAVVGLVKFSNHMLNKQPIDKLSFELAVLSSGSETKRDNRRPRTAICPPTGNKTKPIGNATTVNNVIARNYNNTKSNEKRYRRPKTTATCRASKTQTYREEHLRGQKWQCSKSRNKLADTGKTAQETYPKPQATLAMLAAVEIADEKNRNFKAILRPSFTPKCRLTPSPDIYNTKPLQTNHGSIRSKEINVVNMNKTFKHGYQLSSTMYTNPNAGNADTKLDEFKPKLEIKLKESNVRYNGRVKEVCVENTDRDVSSPVSSTDQLSRPVSRHQTKTPTVVSMTPVPYENEVPLSTPNGLQSSMPQRICWQRRAGSAAGKEKEKNKDNKVKILISKNNIHQTFPEGDISVVSKRVDTGNSSRRTYRPKTGNSSRRVLRPKTGTSSRQTLIVNHQSPHSRNTENSMNKYTAADDAPTDCSALICNECQKTKDVRLDCKMLFTREPSSYEESANNCSHQKKYNLHKQSEEMKQRDYLQYKRSVSSPQNILSKKAVSMLRRNQHRATDNNIKSQPRPSMNYGQANIVTIVTKPPILKTDKNKNIAEKNQIGNTIDQSRAEDQELYEQMTSFGYTLERRLSNAFKDGHIISMMKRTSDDFALNVY